MCFGLVQDQKWSFGNPDWTISTFGNKKEQFSRCKNFYILPEKQGLIIIFKQLRLGLICDLLYKARIFYFGGNP